MIPEVECNQRTYVPSRLKCKWLEKGIVSCLFYFDILARNDPRYPSVLNGVHYSISRD